MRFFTLVHLHHYYALRSPHIDAVSIIRVITKQENVTIFTMTPPLKKKKEKKKRKRMKEIRVALLGFFRVLCSSVIIFILCCMRYCCIFCVCFSAAFSPFFQPPLPSAILYLIKESKRVKKIRAINAN